MHEITQHCNLKGACCLTFAGSNLTVQSKLVAERVGIAKFKALLERMSNACMPNQLYR